jgi:hypothetical protein
MQVRTRSYAIGERRKQSRIFYRSPITVCGHDIFGNFFSQQATTQEISSYGVRLQGVPPVALNSTLLVVHRGESAKYRVAWVGESATRWEGQVGLECVEPEKRIFGDDSLTSSDYVFFEYRRIEDELYLCEALHRIQRETNSRSFPARVEHMSRVPAIERMQAQIRTLKGLLHYLCLVLEDPRRRWNVAWPGIPHC